MNARTDRALDNLELVALRDRAVVAECADNPGRVRTRVLGEEDRADLACGAGHEHDLPGSSVRGGGRGGGAAQVGRRLRAAQVALELEQTAAGVAPGVPEAVAAH
jgi:hypothetical protein